MNAGITPWPSSVVLPSAGFARSEFLPGISIPLPRPCHGRVGDRPCLFDRLLALGFHPSLLIASLHAFGLPVAPLGWVGGQQKEGALQHQRFTEIVRPCAISIEEWRDNRFAPFVWTFVRIPLS